MGEQDVLDKALAVAAHPAVFHRSAGKLRAQRLELRFGDGEGYQPGASRQQFVTELPGHLIAEAGGAEGWNRQGLPLLDLHTRCFLGVQSWRPDAEKLQDGRQVSIAIW